jgi:hypothetical protein
MDNISLLFMVRPLSVLSLAILTLSAILIYLIYTKLPSRCQLGICRLFASTPQSVKSPSILLAVYVSMLNTENIVHLIAAIVLALAIWSWGLTWLKSVKHGAYLDGVVYVIEMERKEWTKKEKRWYEAAEAWKSLLEQCRRQELTQRQGEEALLELGGLLPRKGEGEDGRPSWVRESAQACGRRY